MLKEIEAERDAIAFDRERVGDIPTRRRSRISSKLKAIGAEIATVLTGEVFTAHSTIATRWRAMWASRRVLSRAGSKCRDQGISKAGNPKARSTMIELAWLWLRHQPDSPLSIWFQERVGTRKGRIRRITIVAVARKLLIALWRYLETGVVPTGAVLN